MRWSDLGPQGWRNWPDWWALMVFLGLSFLIGFGILALQEWVF